MDRLPRFRNDFIELATGRRPMIRPRGDIIVDSEGVVVHLREGLRIVLFDHDLNDLGIADELEVDGVVHFDSEEQVWVAEIDWSGFRYKSGQPYR